MLGSVTERDSIREIVEDLLDPAAVSSFSAFEDAAFATEHDLEQMFKWQGQLRSETKLKKGTDSEPKKRKTEEAQSESWLEDIRHYVRSVPAVSIADDA